MFRYDDRVRTRTGTLRQILLPASQQGPNRGPLAPRRESKRKYCLYFLRIFWCMGRPHPACDRSFGQAPASHHLYNYSLHVIRQNLFHTEMEPHSGWQLLTFPYAQRISFDLIRSRFWIAQSRNASLESDDE